MVVLYFLLSFQTYENTFGTDVRHLTLNHIAAANSGFSSFIVLDNPLDEAQTLYVSSYSADRYPLGSETLTVPAQSMLRFEAFPEGTAYAELWYGPAYEAGTAGHMTADPFVGNVFLGFKHQSGMGSEALQPIEEFQSLGSKFRFSPGNWQVHFDGLVIFAEENRDTQVWLRQMDQATQAVLREEVIDIDLAEWGQSPKRTYLLGGPSGSDFLPPEGTYFELESDRLISVTVLRGNVPGGAEANLWTVPTSRVAILPPQIDLFQATRTSSTVILNLATQHQLNTIIRFTTPVGSSPVISSNGQGTGNEWSMRFQGITGEIRFQLSLLGADGKEVKQELVIPAP